VCRAARLLHATAATISATASAVNTAIDVKSRPIPGCVAVVVYVTVWFLTSVTVLVAVMGNVVVLVMVVVSVAVWVTVVVTVAVSVTV